MNDRVIVYADDDKDLRSIMTELLESSGYTVRGHENGKSALEDLRELTVQGQRVLLLTDYDMPVMDGIELLQAMKKEDINVPSIMLSANPDIEKLLDDAGVRDRLGMLLGKPVRGVAQAIKIVADKYDRLQPTSHTGFAQRDSEGQTPDF